jgi:hypothetical protein
MYKYDDMEKFNGRRMVDGFRKIGDAHKFCFLQGQEYVAWMAIIQTYRVLNLRLQNARRVNSASFGMSNGDILQPLHQKKNDHLVMRMSYV